jgi:hypothetical protein
MQGGKRNIINAGYQNSSGGHAHQAHQQQLLQQIQKQSSHHFVGSFGNNSGTGPGSSHGNQYGNSGSGNEFLLESQKIIYAPPSREKSKQTVRSPLIFEAGKGSLNGLNNHNNNNH